MLASEPQGDAYAEMLQVSIEGRVKEEWERLKAAKT